MLGRITSLGSTHARLFAWRAQARRLAPLGASLAANLLLFLLLSGYVSGGWRWPEPVTIELVSAEAPRPAIVLPPPSVAKPPAQARPSATAPKGGAIAMAPPAANAGSTEPETLPAETAPPAATVPKGLQGYLQADPCVDPGKRKLHPECGSALRAATDAEVRANPDKQYAQQRADRVAAMEVDLHVRSCSPKTFSAQIGLLNAGSSHLGCGAPSNKTTNGANKGGANPVIVDVVRVYGNSYHEDPGFGD